jgi:formylmethanofuran dehydrogenase subunit C
MADKIPLEGIFDGSGNVTGLAEYRSADGDTLGVIHGGTGLATIAANRIVTGNGTSAVTAEANLTFDGSTLAVTGDTTISGNLTVQGNFTETVKIATEDPIIALNTAIGSGAANTYDSGFVTERGSSTNVALIWDESEDLFNFITTTDTGVTSGNINVSGQADIKTGSITSTGNLAISGTLTGVTNFNLTGTLQFDSGQTVNEISDDTTLTDGAATALVTENAIKTHVSAQASAFAIALG